MSGEYFEEMTELQEPKSLGVMSACALAWRVSAWLQKRAGKGLKYAVLEMDSAFLVSVGDPAKEKSDDNGSKATTD
jgi:hypothetical protein